MNELIELLNNIKDEKEKTEIINEFVSIYSYKIDILNNNANYKDIDKFISKIINKYRGKDELKDFYNSKDGDQIPVNRFDTLLILENMIYNYILRKLILDIGK